ncbi:hypothetical protein IWT140_00050 [Secundilactobacillus pentosiphilus]|uniref:Uncharacterized protein n=1 Tax=Secundilactobacillus pentosiphilus TaxID=1714682 RepID=A0A1Z5IL08_9LACO|nr:DUF1516 family protein [Secundilactobacillus pentosiphilus]GAX02454.1 hypothetical protein IWT140_00050 [Secundilactobacillus pentosiphilus]
MWLTIYFMSLILLIPVTIIGLNRKSEKKIAQWLIIDRLMYLLMACATVILMIRTFNHSPLLVSLKGVLAVIIILIIEIAFGHKQERSLSITWSVVITIVILITAAVGIITTLRSI